MTLSTITLPSSSYENICLQTITRVEHNYRYKIQAHGFTRNRMFGSILGSWPIMSLNLGPLRGHRIILSGIRTITYNKYKSNDLYEIVPQDSLPLIKSGNDFGGNGT